MLLLPVLVACGNGDETTDVDDGQVAWNVVETPVATVSSTPLVENAGSGGAVEWPIQLDEEGLTKYQPDELGRIPILMYHAFTNDPEYLDEWTVTYDQFRDDLNWLYEHDFFIVSMRNMIHNELAVPPGKHPVVLTFDDASSGQFRLLKDPGGTFRPDPTTAVGVMEEFFARHPDFGRGALFALLPYNCFRHEGEQSTCEERLDWLAANGYEIANHTWDHQNLSDVSGDTLMAQVAQTKIFIDERVTGDANMSGMLVLPYGAFPGYDWEIQLLHDGFVWDGQTISLSGIITVTGGPSPSPSSGDWTRWSIDRINTDRETFGFWQQQIEDGEITMFTSDGDPATVTIPDPIPEDIAPQFDLDWAQAYDMRVIRYTPSPLPDS